MSDGKSTRQIQRIEVEVPLEVSEYLDEWADAIGAEVAEVGGDAITQFLEEGDCLD